MKYFFTVFALSSLFAQNELIVKIDSLNALKDLFNSQALYAENRIKNIDEQINELEWMLTKQNFEPDNIKPVMRKLKRGGTLWKEKPLLSESINLPIGAELTIYPNWYKDTNNIYSEFNGVYGWMNVAYIDEKKLPKIFTVAKRIHIENYNDLSRKKKEEEKLASDKRIARVNEKISRRKTKYYKNLENKYGNRNANAIVDSKVYIGMPKELVIMSIGEPSSEKKSRNEMIDQIQMIYDNENSDYKYIFLENGIVQSFTSRK